MYIKVYQRVVIFEIDESSLLMYFCEPFVFVYTNNELSDQGPILFSSHLSYYKSNFDYAQDLSNGEILAGRPGAWLVKKRKFICMQSQNFQKDLILKFKTISRTCFVFMIALTVMSKEDIFMFVMVAPTQNKTIKIEITCRVFKLEL